MKEWLIHEEHGISVRKPSSPAREKMLVGTKLNISPNYTKKVYVFTYACCYSTNEKKKAAVVNGREGVTFKLQSYASTSCPEIGCADLPRKFSLSRLLIGNGRPKIGFQRIP
jgi:hypothetical protein